MADRECARQTACAAARHGPRAHAHGRAPAEAEPRPGQDWGPEVEGSADLPLWLPLACCRRLPGLQAAGPGSL